MKRVALILGLLLSILPSKAIEAKSIWLLYEKTDVQPYPLLGHVILEGVDSELSIEKQEAMVFERLDTLKTGKPIVTKRDDTFVSIVGIDRQDVKCTKEEGTFKQVDAALAPATAQAAQGQFVAHNIYCDLETRDKGGVKVIYTIDAAPDKQSKPGGQATTDEKSEMILGENRDKGANKKDPTNAGNGGASTSRDILVKSEVRVHELYRFRVTAGPVYSSLIPRNKTFTTYTNPSGQNVIASNDDNQGPVNFPVFLKVYLWERDILEPVPLYMKFNPILGINLVDNPLKNFYTGVSFEPTLGIDFVAGVHWAKLKGLQPGFSEGQVVSSAAPPPTKEQFFGGWFVGVTVDVGVVGSWLGSQVMRTFQGQAK